MPEFRKGSVVEKAARVVPAPQVPPRGNWVPLARPIVVLDRKMDYGAGVEVWRSSAFVRRWSVRLASGLTRPASGMRDRSVLRTPHWLSLHAGSCKVAGMS